MEMDRSHDLPGISQSLWNPLNRRAGTPPGETKLRFVIPRKDRPNFRQTVANHIAPDIGSLERTIGGEACCMAAGLLMHQLAMNCVLLISDTLTVRFCLFAARLS